MFKLKNPNKICRRYEVDLWGKFRLKKQYNFVYGLMLSRLKERYQVRNLPVLEIDRKRALPRRKRKSFYGEFLENRKKICYYYGGLRKKTYRQLNSLVGCSTGSIKNAPTVLTLLERRLSAVVFRMNFSGTILESYHMVYSGFILVNKKIITDPGYLISPGDAVEVISFKKEDYFRHFVERLLSRQILVLQPKYIEINYGVMAGILHTNPKIVEVPLPFKIPSDFFHSEFYGKF